MRRAALHTLSGVLLVGGCYLIFAGARAAFFLHVHKSDIYRVSNALLLLLGFAAIWLALRLHERLSGRFTGYFAKPST